MATQEALASRLRKLIDDVGHGYSQSAPGFSTNLSALGAPVNLGVQIDEDTAPSDITLGAAASLVTGPAIASAIQSALRAAQPTKPGWANAAVVFDRMSGYTIRSGTQGSYSYVRVLPPSAGSDAAAQLKLGQPYGGYETPAHVRFTDEDLFILLDEALNTQNEVGTPTLWTYATIPPAYETLIAYRAWSSIIDIALGQTATRHWQKVEQEESHEDQIFGNYLKLADWLKKKIADLQTELDGGTIEVTTATRWNYEQQAYLAIDSHKDQEMRISLPMVSWVDASTAVLEFSELLSPGLVEISFGYRQTDPGVIDRSIFNDPEYESKYAQTKGFVSPSVLARTIRNGRNTVVKITGLDDANDYYFAAVAVDIDGIRYFSNEVLLPQAP